MTQEILPEQAVQVAKSLKSLAEGAQRAAEEQHSLKDGVMTKGIRFNLPDVEVSADFLFPGDYMYSAYEIEFMKGLRVGALVATLESVINGTNEADVKSLQKMLETVQRGEKIHNPFVWRASIAVDQGKHDQTVTINAKTNHMMRGAMTLPLESGRTPVGPMGYTKPEEVRRGSAVLPMPKPVAIK